MKQTSIMSQVKKKFSQLYLHELEEGDVFCLSNSEIKRGEVRTVLSSDYSKNHLGIYTGSMKIEHKFFGGRKTFEYPSSKAMVLVFLSEAE